MQLNPESTYAPIGEMRRRNGERIYTDDKGIEHVLPGGMLIRRPFGLGLCERRAYQEAKALYKGQQTRPDDVPLSGLRTFADRHVDSMRAQPDGPVE